MKIPWTRKHCEFSDVLQDHQYNWKPCLRCECYDGLKLCNKRSIALVRAGYPRQVINELLNVRVVYPRFLQWMLWNGFSSKWVICITVGISFIIWWYTLDKPMWQDSHGKVILRNIWGHITMAALISFFSSVCPVLSAKQWGRGCLMCSIVTSMKGFIIFLQCGVRCVVCFNYNGCIEMASPQCALSSALQGK